MLKPTPPIDQSGERGLDKPTLRELFESEETSLLRYAFSLVGRRAVAEEIVQEVFLQLHAHWEEVDCPQAWLTRSVRNKAFNHLRDNNRETLNSDHCKMPTEKATNETPQQSLSTMEDRRIVRQLLQELDETDRQLVRLKYYNDLKYRDISAQTGMSISNVGYRLHHILKELASKLSPLGID